MVTNIFVHSYIIQEQPLTCVMPVCVTVKQKLTFGGEKKCQQAAILNLNSFITQQCMVSLAYCTVSLHRTACITCYNRLDLQVGIRLHHINRTGHCRDRVFRWRLVLLLPLPETESYHNPGNQQDCEDGNHDRNDQHHLFISDVIVICKLYQ